MVLLMPVPAEHLTSPAGGIVSAEAEAVLGRLRYDRSDGKLAVRKLISSTLPWLGAGYRTTLSNPFNHDTGVVDWLSVKLVSFSLLNTKSGNWCYKLSSLCPVYLS